VFQADQDIRDHPEAFLTADPLHHIAAVAVAVAVIQEEVIHQVLPALLPVQHILHPEAHLPAAGDRCNRNSKLN
jgi:hypothetical protein